MYHLAFLDTLGINPKLFLSTEKGSGQQKYSHLYLQDNDKVLGTKPAQHIHILMP